MRTISGWLVVTALAMRLQDHRLARAGGGHDEGALALAERAEEVHDAGGELVRGRLEPDPPLRVERGQVVEEDLLLRAVGRLEVDRVHLDEGEVALVLLGRADLAADRVPGAQVELADLRGRDVDVVRPRQVAVLGGAQEAEAVGQDLEDALGEDEPFLLRLRAQDLEHQLLLLHRGGAGDLQRLGHLDELLDAHLLEHGEVEAAAAVVLRGPRPRGALRRARPRLGRLVLGHVALGQARLARLGLALRPAAAAVAAVARAAVAGRPRVAGRPSPGRRTAGSSPGGPGGVDAGSSLAMAVFLEGDGGNGERQATRLLELGRMGER